MTAPRPLAPRRALGVVALILLIVISQFGALLHLSLAKHAVCPEHGELVHVDVHGLEAQAAPSDERPGAYDPAGPIRSDEHDHCAVAVIRDEPGICPKAFVLRAPPAGAVASSVATPVECVRTPGVATYLLAPKQSPPV